MQAFKARTGQSTQFILNEFIPFVNDWCDLTTAGPNRTAAASCPDWTQRAAAGYDPDLQHAKGQ